MSLTQLFQHLVALVEHKVLEILDGQLLGAGEGEDTARGAHHNVWAVVLQHLLVLGDREAAEEYPNLQSRRQ